MKRILKWQPKYERIYCFPNRFGFVGFATFLVMLAAGATYQNNLIFMMAFLFLSLGLIAILQTARNLREIEVIAIDVEPVFESGATQIHVKIKNPTTDLKLQNEVKLKVNGKVYSNHVSELPPQSYKESSLAVTAPAKCGVYRVERPGIYTSFPYALFTAWKFTKKIAEMYVYPTPHNYGVPLSTSTKNEEDFSGHKKLEAGDSIARIDWKVLARKNEVYVRQFHDGVQKKIYIRWQDTDKLDFKKRISQISYWVTKAEYENAIYQVELPNHISTESSGPQHYRQNMEALTRLAT